MGSRELTDEGFGQNDAFASLPVASLFEQAEQLRSSGQTAEAIALYKSWLSVAGRQDAHVVWFNLGSLLQAEGDLGGAIAS